MAQNNTRIELRISDDLLDDIDRQASDAGVSRAEWIRQTCNERIERGYELEEYTLVTDGTKKVED